jgi:ribonucleoside-diphosphate reductase alpha chain
MEPFTQSLSYQVWKDTYKWETDNTVYDTFRRVAKYVASVEKDKGFWEDKYYELLSNFRYIPGGRILSNAGTGLKGTCLINCFVSGFRGEDQDSIASIYAELTRQATILKSEGGYGCNFDVLRPRGSYISGSGIESPGTVEIMNLWNASSAVITAGSGKKKTGKGKGKIRKGAQMGCLSVSHPSIEEFITAKQKPGVLDKFNLSVLITDEFIDAVKNHKPWNLEFPDTNFEKYSPEWDGDLKEWKKKGYPVNVWKTYSDANELWNIIIESTHKRNEPGVIFIDRVNELNNLKYCEKIFATNPCGEEPLPIGGACVLSSINLTQYISKDKTDFDLKALEEDIPTMVRFLDSINDLTAFPLAEQKKQAQNKRRIGIGYTGYGSALYLLKLGYSSEEALQKTEKLCKFVVNKIYKASSMLAEEKGTFPLFDKEQFLQSNFVKQALTEATINKIKEHGLRNSHLTMVAPTGNSSIFANNVSGGLEPVISPKYIRTVIEVNPPDDLVRPINIDWDRHVYEIDNGWEWILEGDDRILRKEHSGIVYKIDRNRGLTREETIYDYSVLNNSEFNEKDSYVKTIMNLTVKEHIDTMKIFAKYTDAAISKTINIPEDYSFEKFKDVYMNAYESGVVKGVTTYRWGTMASVISSADTTNDSIITERDAPKRPTSLPCHVYKITVKGEQWVVFVGLYNGHPYEVFTGKVDLVDIPATITEGSIIKIGSGKYQFEHNKQIIIKDISRLFESGEQEALTRQISINLQHGTPLDRIIEQLNKSYGTIVDFNKSIVRALKRYMKEKESGEKCPTCGSVLIYTEGCLMCKNCGLSKCG